MVELSPIFQQELKLIFEEIQHQLDRRKPGQSSIVTQRKESDTVQFLSGTFEGKSTGTPIGFVIYNEKIKNRKITNILPLLTDLLMQILRMTKNLEFVITEVAENLQREKPSIGLQQELWRNIFYPKM